MKTLIRRPTAPALSLSTVVLVCAGLAAQAAEPAAAPPVATPLPAAVERTIAQLRTAGLADTNAYAIVEDLVTRIGPRLAGTPEEARARDWAAAMLRAQGFSNVKIETFPVPAWMPLSESAAITAPAQQPLSVTAIGGSPSTATGGIEGDVIRFGSVAEMVAAPADDVRGRLVFIDEPMARSTDGAGYGVATGKRRGCGPAAKRKGALACLIRAVGTNTDRFTHQGMGTAGTDLTLVPTLAVAPPDADILTRLLARDTTPVRVRLQVSARVVPDAPSGNVLAEVRGRERPDEIVLAAAHLDSWTLGQGAVDDGTGIAIITAAAKLVNDLPVKPRRTIRLLLAGSEEQGGHGGIAYHATHRAEKHVVAAESDTGAGRVWRLDTRFGADDRPHVLALQRMLAPLAIVPGDNTLPPGSGGTDISAMTADGVPVIGLKQDASKYFDVHHTANDTLAQVDPAELRQNVAAWAATLYLVAEMDWDLR
jgi:carboxypeptidase Q